MQPWSIMRWRFLQLALAQFAIFALMLYKYSEVVHPVISSKDTSASRVHAICKGNLLGNIVPFMNETSYREIQRLNAHLSIGGRWKPKNCIYRQSVAVIVPFRDRESHLRLFLHNLHPVLTRQQLNYAIYVVEQVGNETFNKAKLMNIGFVEASKEFNWDCFIFHDVDLLPENDLNLYECGPRPRHLSVAIDRHDYKVMYGIIFGGVTALAPAQFIDVNGFSNSFFGWGGEDDEMSGRVSHLYRMQRAPQDKARYKMVQHADDKGNPKSDYDCRIKLIKAAPKRYQKDGLTSLNYTIIEQTKLPLFTHILADIHFNESKAALRAENICPGVFNK